MNNETMVVVLEYLIWVIFGLAILSFLSCAFIIILFLTRKHLRTFVFELLFHMAISEILNSIAKMMSIYKIFYFDDVKSGLKDEVSIFCIIQKILGNYSDFATFLLIVIISYTLYTIMLKMNKEVKGYIKTFRLIIYLIPLGVTLGLSFLPLGKTDKPRYQCWCWIPIRWKYTSFFIYIVYWVFIGINLYITCKTTSFLKKLMKNSSEKNLTNIMNDEEKKKALVVNENNNKIRNVIVKLYVYPIVAIVIWFFSTASRFYELFYYDPNKDFSKMPDWVKNLRVALYIIQAVLMSSRGLIYAILYFLKYEKIKKEVFKIGRQIEGVFCGCCKKKRKVTFDSADDSDFSTES